MEGLLSSAYHILDDSIYPIRTYGEAYRLAGRGTFTS
jgi:hypothetical protein